jgi:malonate transporter
MLDTILGALLPMVVTFLLGFVAAWRHDFALKDASILNRMVLLYAVPLTLFAGTVSTPLTELSQDIPVVVALGVAIIGLYGVVFLLCRIALRLPMSISALASLMASAPAAGFVGPAVLGNLFGELSAIPIAIACLVNNLTVVPLTILLLGMRTEGDFQAPAAPDAGHSASPTSRRSNFTTALAETVRQPLVWAPVLAFVIVLSGARIPHLVTGALAMLGQASGGVALFACGIVLASNKVKIDRNVLSVVFLKNIVQPGLVLASLRWFGYHNPIVSSAVLTSAIAGMPIVIMLALQYRVAQADAASAEFLSMTGSVVTMGVFIALTR